MLRGAYTMWLAGTLLMAAVQAEERQVTFSLKNHRLDNNDNFSADGRFVVYDTRETNGPGIENGTSIEMVDLQTGQETELYAARHAVSGKEAAPGIAAVSFCPVANKVIFIHGPYLQDVHWRGWYAKPNRQGVEVPADGTGRPTFVDTRDISRDRAILPGAHRGGTHRHEYSLDGKRIGFTYDDYLMPEYGRTIGFMVEHPRTPLPGTHYFALLVPVAPQGAAKPGELETALGDSWVGREGLMRAFIGKVREQDGSYMESLFVIDVPADVDVTTADSGTATRYPSPPKGIGIRRLTHSPASGVVRGSVDGRWIAFYAPDKAGRKQVFLIPSDGSDRDTDPAKRPVQATDLPEGAESGLRWHPSGHSIICVSNGGIVATCVKAGAQFGQSIFLTPHGDGPPRFDPVWSLDGKRIAYNRAVPAKDEQGAAVQTYNGKDFEQVFILDFPDADEDGVADSTASNPARSTP